MKPGRDSKRNRKPSRAAASVHAATRRSQLRVILVEPRDLVRDCVANCLRVADPDLTVLEYSSIHDVDLTQSDGTIALVLLLLSTSQEMAETSQEMADVAAEVSRAQDQVPQVPVVVVADGDDLNSCGG